MSVGNPKLSPAVSSANRLKLGTFGTNGNGTAMTLVPDRKPLNWPATMSAAIKADNAGFEAIVPYQRWKAYDGLPPDHPSGVVFDPFVFAGAIAQATNYATIFATSPTLTNHPVLTARQAATIDHVSGGRFALNVVAGWNRAEFEMFGMQMEEHTDRYDHATEWLEVLHKLWSEPGEIDYTGKYFNLVKAVSRPQPIQGRIPVMNASGSGKGRQFAARYADLCFVVMNSEDEESCRAQVDDYKRLAREEFGREINVWVHTYVVQRETQKEADEYLHRYAVEMRDNPHLDAWLRGLAADTKLMPAEALERLRMRFAAGGGGFPLVGTPERIVDRMAMLSRVGIAGTLLTWIDYEDGLDRWNQGVMPLLEQAGLREPFRPAT